MTNERIEPNAHIATATDLAALDAYRIFFNFYCDDDQTFATLDDFLTDPDIANTIFISHLDDNATHIYFDYDTCQITLLILTDAHDHIASIFLSTDTMPYEPLILDSTRR